MSEYQYYEFLAIDRPLTDRDRRDLRALSTRARITATSFTNSYEWGDFKGDPAKLIERWFDLHLYFARWGSRRLIIKLPARLIEDDRLGAYLERIDDLQIRTVDEILIVDIARDELESDDDDDGSGWLGALAPVRAAVLAGDLRLFYLLWLMGVEVDVFEADEREPLPGIGPMTEELKAFVGFFGIDPDLVQAAAESSPVAMAGEIASDATRKAIAALPDQAKIALLGRVLDNDPLVAADLRRAVRTAVAPENAISAPLLRTVGELRLRAQDLRRLRERAVEERMAETQRQQAAAADEARRTRRETLRRRGESVWQEIETEIERRNPAGYDKATGILSDLRDLAADQNATEEFNRRLQAIRLRHVRKERFIERLSSFG